MKTRTVEGYRSVLSALAALAVVAFTATPGVSEVSGADAGSATFTTWIDVDGQLGPDPFYYRVISENSGGATP